jgi:hypothetical protein
MAEHMRISLIDPRWKEQRDAMLSKIRETTKVCRWAGSLVSVIAKAWSGAQVHS